MKKGELVIRKTEAEKKVMQIAHISAKEHLKWISEHH